MLVASVMTPQPETIQTDATANAALRTMRAHRFRHFPVVQNDHVVGIVSDRDLAEAASTTRVADIMHRDVIVVRPDEPVEVAARMLIANKIGALPVMDGDKLVGVVSQIDLLDTLTRLLGAYTPSSRLALTLTDLGKQIHQITALAHDLGVTITSLVTVPGSADADGSTQVVLRVATMVPGPLIAALKSAGIAVDEPRRDGVG